MNRFFSFSLLALSTTTFVACAGPKKVDFKDAQYWQRANASEAIYQRGPKAQQMIHRDISRCVSELHELERMRTIKDAFPAPDTMPDLEDEKVTLKSWETPERDGYLLNEVAVYYDFEECMDARGWERVAHLPYKTKIRAEEDYIRALSDSQNKRRSGTRDDLKTDLSGSKRKSEKGRGDFDSLND